ncbi:hypothetical protein JCM10213_005305 [Rhodosporidiobolus nylandii]
MALQSAQNEQQLLYALRNPTTPLAAKVADAASALDSSSSASLPPLVRDWALETLVKATRVAQNSATEATLLSTPLWLVLARAADASPSPSTPHPTLPIFVSFAAAYSSTPNRPNEDLLRGAVDVWRKLAAGGMRKATPDQALDSYEKLLEASAKVLHGSRSEQDRRLWEELAVVWLKTLRTVVLEGGKGGKKVPTHTLSLLPKLLPLLDLLPSSSPFRLVLLQTVQFAVFNLENLRRGLARETYAAGGAPSSSISTADTELFAALSSLPASLSSSIYGALSAFTSAYFSSLSTYSATLFPLPAKATFATPSAQKSALEVLALTKRRELAGRWVKGVVELLTWPSAGHQTSGAMQVDGVRGEGGKEQEKARALAAVLREVEKEDLYRAGQAGEEWAGVLPSVVGGAVSRLQAGSQPDEREALAEALSAVAQLSYEAIEPALPAVLAVLAQTPSSSASSSPSVDAFLAHLIAHHSRSMTLPTLLTLISDALASSASISVAANNLLTSHVFFEKLGHAVSGLIGGASGVRATYENLVAPVREASALATAVGQGEADEASPSPAKKRRLSPSPSAAVDILAASSRLRVLGLFVAHVPSSALPSLVEPLRSLAEVLLEPRLKDFTKAAKGSSSSVTATEADGDVGTPSKKDKKKRRQSGLLPDALSNGVVEPEVRLGIELLEVRYAALERLNREGLLEMAEDGAKWWGLKGKRRDGLREVVEKADGEAAVVAARTLLQHLELDSTSSSSSADEAHAYLSAVLHRIAAGSSGARWSSFLRRMKEDEVPVALWELVSRRWMHIVETRAADEQLKQFVKIALRAFSSSATISDLTIPGATARLLRRADFWECSRLQAVFQPALIALATLPSLSSPSTLLSTPDDKALVALRSLAPSTLLSTARLFRFIAATVPLEYLVKQIREQLAEHALALDLWISTGKVAIADEEKAGVQRDMRLFVALLGVSVPSLSVALFRLFHVTFPGAKDATLQLFRSLVQNVVAGHKASQSHTELVALLASFGDKPLTDLQQRLKKGKEFRLTTEESAFLVLLETLATTLPDLAHAPSALVEAVSAPAKAALKTFDKVLPLATTAIKENNTAVFQLADVLDAARSLRVVKQWLTKEKDDTAAFITFTETALAAALTQAPSFASHPSAPSSTLALLRLLSYRLRHDASNEGQTKTSTAPFETFVVCHLAFRRTLPLHARPGLNENLVRSVSAASLEEYAAALDGISTAVGTTVAAASSAAALGELEQALDVALVLLRDGPEGSSRLAGTALSNLLRHLSLLVEHAESENARAVKAYLLVARFLEGICGERPMLLSRLNVSTTFSLVSRLLQPSQAFSSPRNASCADASNLFRTLVTTVTHLVRHRKDHVVPLFPLLASALSSFISMLRRAGYGTTGSTLSIDDVDASVALGQRAERDAKATFPAWVWEGGSEAIGRAEAKAVGRLLGALTAKTATQVVKRKKEPSGAAEEALSTTTSLAAPLSKHAPFLLLTYLRACVHSTCPIPSALRSEMQGGWFEVMDSMGKWEKEALMKGFLGEEEEAERGVLRSLWKTWEKERYRG